MESNFSDLKLCMSGNMSSENTLLITDIFGLFPSSFNKLLPMLEERYRVISYTDNGFDIFNRTSHLRHQTLEGYADDLIASLRQKGLSNITYVAHSVNAMLAFYVAVKEPDLFEKIVLLSGSPDLKSDLASLFNYDFNTITSSNILFDSVCQSGMHNNEVHEQFHTLLGQSFSKISVDKARLIFNLIMSADVRSYLNRITVPVMILQGVGDKNVTSETAYFMHRHIPNSYLVRIKAKGHLPQLNAPEEVFKAMEIFMYRAVC